MYKSIFEKPADMKYSDMCIYIDNTFYTENCDKDLCFQYMCSLAYMLARKAKYFSNTTDYQDYSYFLAKEVFRRMSKTDKPQLKSVSNYMKSIMRFRKNAYLRDTFVEIIDPEYDTAWNSDLYESRLRDQIESLQNGPKQMEIIDVLSHIPDYIKESIPKIYIKDKLIYHNLYLSVELTLLNSFTLPTKKDPNNMARISNNTGYENYLWSNLDIDDIILWGLNDDYKSLVQLIINKTRIRLKDEIYDVIHEFTLSESDFNELMVDLMFGENDD